ncbi:MAG: bifunctional glutamate N-acetyltransferase/amino-acid acetyltransferase ArgJ [Pseudomonadota bacterium]
MDLKRSPLAPDTLANLPAINGVRIATAATGMKYAGRDDFMLMLFDEGATIAGVFTTSRCPSAPVDWCRERLGNGRVGAIAVNAGNANAFTGQKGIQAVEETAAGISSAAGVDASHIHLASTGVIGEPLEASMLTGHLADMVGRATSENWPSAAEAIRTTDTFAKLATANADIDGKTVTINGIAKGSGMIAPDMATMLAFVVTDAPIAAPVLRSLLTASNETSFNAVTVDSDTSTSDTVLAVATGAADGVSAITEETDPRLAGFRSAFDTVMQDLALQVVRDGEGATKLVKITIEGAEDAGSAKRIALAVANSPLVKTAIAGEDANWGRIVMAIGKAGETADRDQLSISFGDVEVARNGERVPDYSEEAASAVMQRDEIAISANVGVGNGSATVWTCDLTKTYIEINGDYRS